MRPWALTWGLLLAVAWAAPRHLRLPVGQPIPLSTTATPTPLDPQLVKLEKKGERWLVTGLEPGPTQLQVGPDVWDLEFLHEAATWPKQARVQTFGAYPAAAALLHWGRDFLHERAQIALSGGELQARGPDLLSAAQKPKLEVVDRTLEPTSANWLVLSNWPEKIEADQVLIETTVPPEPTRVMLHHRNMPEQPNRWLEVELIQTRGEGVYALSPHLAGPSADEIFAGHLAAVKYFDHLTGHRRQGYIVRLGQGERHLVERQDFKPAQTISGMLWLQTLSGGGATLKISTREPSNAGPLERREVEEGARTARGVYPATIVRELKYTVGSAYLYEDVGAAPYLTSVDSKQPSPGNFGAVYRISCLLSNPTDQMAEVRAELSARGGPARATLWVDGERVETGLLAAQPQLLRRWVLAPAEQRTVYVETFPQAGSNFPLHLVFSSRAGAGEPSPASQWAGWTIP